LADAVEVEADDVAAAITKVATDQSLILLASKRASQWLEAASVGEAVVQVADKMLLLCGPHCDQPPMESSVVVPLDGSPRAEEAISPAVAIARRWGSRLWIVTAIPESTAETVAALRAEGQEVSESAYVRGVAERLADTHEVDVGWQMIHDDDPVAAVSAFVEEQGSSMIVAATHGETGVARRLFGSVCMGLVEQAGVPVLIVKSAKAEEPALTSADA
ncbi:MAG: universal stress protein, partial [Acidimicrobiia bacterium]|nr:universal stress protein [Acidimicrobiia bacterium]